MPPKKPKGKKASVTQATSPSPAEWRQQWDRATDDLWGVFSCLEGGADLDRPVTKEDYLDCRNTVMDLISAVGRKVGLVNEKRVCKASLQALDNLAGFSAEKEKRYAPDGCLYTEEDFCTYYGLANYADLWKDAPLSDSASPTDPDASGSGPTDAGDPAVQNALPSTLWANKAGRVEKRETSDGKLLSEIEFRRRFKHGWEKEWDAARREAPGDARRRGKTSPKCAPEPIQDEWS